MASGFPHAVFIAKEALTSVRQSRPVAGQGVPEARKRVQYGPAENCIGQRCIVARCVFYLDVAIAGVLRPASNSASGCGRHWTTRCRRAASTTAEIGRVGLQPPGCAVNIRYLAGIRMVRR